MYLNVDCVGIDSVCKMIQQTGLKRFIIFRQGAQKGSTPVYDCSSTGNNAAALKCFRDWASNAISFNPNNGMTYDLLLFNNENDTDEEATNKRANKIRFSFALNNFMAFGQQQTQQQAPQTQIDIQAEIQKGIAAAMMHHKINELEARIKEYEEDDDDDEQEDVFDKVLGIINGLKGENINAAQMNGDTDTSLDDEAVVEEKIKKKFTPAQLKIKQDNQRKALAKLWSKNSNLDEDLLRLAKLADENFILFKMTIQKLRSMVTL